MFLLTALMLFSFADVDLSNVRTLIQEFPSSPLLNEIVVFKPSKDHHFNLKSKNDCGSGRLIKAEESQIECQMSTPGETKLELYVCDDKNTFCRREELTAKTQSPDGIGGWTGYYWGKFINTKYWSAPYRTDVSHVKPARGFIHNDLDKALKEAKSKNQKLFVYFTQIYCPPCRLMKEMTFASDEFQEITKDYVKLQIDIDIDVAPEKIKPLDILGTPTIIVFNNDFKEIGRMMHVRSPKAFKYILDTLGDRPMSEILAADMKSLSSEDLKRASIWHYYTSKGNERTSNALEYAKAIPAPDEEMQFWIKTLQALSAKNGKDTFKIFNEMDPFKINIDSVAVQVYMTSFYGAMDPSFSNAEQRTIAHKYVGYAKKLKDNKEDPLQAAYIRSSVLAIAEWMLKKQGSMVNRSVLTADIKENITEFPRLPGVTDTTQLGFMLADTSEKAETKKELYDQFRSKEKSDYTYDFWEAGDAFAEKRYSEALQYIDESLKRAKDRNWQKALLFKVDILQAMKKSDEARGLIEETLTNIDLPISEYPKIHTFIQQLREKQRALKDDKTTKS